MLNCKDHVAAWESPDRTSQKSLVPERGTGDENRLTLEELADRIRRHKEVLQPDPERRTEVIFALGHALCAAKLKQSHGQFRAWLKDEFGWPERAAQRYMRVARILGKVSDTVSDLTFTALIALAAKTTTEELRREILTELDREEPIMSREVLDRIRAAQDGSPKGTQVIKIEKAQKAAQLLRKELSRESLEMLWMLLDGADAKTFFGAVRIC